MKHLLVEPVDLLRVDEEPVAAVGAGKVEEQDLVMHLVGSNLLIVFTVARRHW